MKSNTLYSDLTAMIEDMEKLDRLISADRKNELRDLGQKIAQSLNIHDYAKVVFVCTHNSRRSQLGQIWMRAAAEYYGIEGIYTYSGGTESTAFNSRMVDAIDRAGFLVKKLDEWDNPKYLIRLSENDLNMDIYFSKKYDDSYNPNRNFIAVMVCTDADEACPIVAGADARISLPYLDPKNFDDTREESRAYNDKVVEIGREMLFVIQNLNK